MTEQQQKWFETLAIDSRNASDAVAKRNWNIWEFIVNHYSEKAHFLYELIQNADDAEAETIHFELYKDRLVFRHNGKKHFIISDPKNEVEDKRNDRLGSVNSIVSVGNSAKSNNDIGKFGIGFKSVFIYTARPEIYDDTFKFAIEDYVVPCLLDRDYDGRKQGETVFVFPFRAGENLQGAARDPYREICTKMRELVHPTFFLKHVNQIDWCYKEEQGNEVQGSYVKEKTELYKSTDNTSTVVERTRLCSTVGTNVTSEEFLVFRRPTILNNELECVIALALDTDGNIIKTDRYAPFCYFPTQSQLGLNFVIQAPFCLTSTRESFDFSNEGSEGRNSGLFDELSTLFADCLVYMRDMYEHSKDSSKLFLSESIFKILPLREFGNNASFLNGFYTKTLAKLQKERIIPASFERGCYCKKENVRIPKFKHIIEVSDDKGLNFDDKDLNEIINEGQAQEQVHWAFAKTRDYSANAQSDINEYIRKLYGVTIDKYFVHNGTILTAISESALLERHSNDERWLEKFYNWFANKVPYDLIRWGSAKLFLNQNNRACAVGKMVNGRFENNLYLPSGDVPQGMTIHVINPVISRFDSFEKLKRTYGIRQFDRTALIDMMIAQANSGDVCYQGEITKKLIEFLGHERTPQGDITKIVSWVQNKGLFKVKSGDFKKISCGLLRHSDFWNDIDRRFNNFFVDDEYYQNVGISEETWERIGIYSHPCVNTSKIIFRVLGEVLNHYSSESSSAAFIWKMVNELVKLDGVAWPDGIHSRLKKVKWISLRNGDCKSPNDITVADFREIRTTINNELASERFAKLFDITIKGTKDFQWALLGGLPRHLGVIGCRNSELRDSCGKSEKLYVEMNRDEKKQFNVEEYRNAIWESGEIIKKSETVQKDMLKALRWRITQFGYGPEKLLFELFQNADDAYMQNEEFNLGEERDGCEFLVKWNKEKRLLVVVHWGRPINKPHENIPGSERDLENMLQMHQSDKQVSSGRNVNEGKGAGVTGKFGLGFKTVFLVSDMPYILSGDLRLKILGGYLPCEFDGDDSCVSDFISDFIRETCAQSAQLPPTIVIIPIRDDAFQSMCDALKLFKERAPYLVNCSQCVKKITIEE